MAIAIERVGSKFIARATPPHTDGASWESKGPMDLDELVKKLLALGCHQTDIGDVLFEIDPKLIGDE